MKYDTINKKQAPDASSAHLLASNDVIGLQRPLNKLQIDNKNLNCSHEILQDKPRKKKLNVEITKKIQLTKQKKNQNEDRNVYVKNENGEIVVYLLDYKNPNTIVARGALISRDPYKIVGGMKLGLEYYEVLTREAVKPNESLLRPYEGVKNVGEAVGKVVAWKTHDVVTKRE